MSRVSGGKGRKGRLWLRPQQLLLPLGCGGLGVTSLPRAIPRVWRCVGARECFEPPTRRRYKAPLRPCAGISLGGRAHSEESRRGNPVFPNSPSLSALPRLFYRWPVGLTLLLLRGAPAQPEAAT